LLLVAIIISIAAAFALRYGGYISSDSIADYIKSNRDYGTYVLLLMYLISPGLMLPTFYLTLLAGMLWGPFYGVMIDITGTTCGSLIAFSISRYVAGDYVKSKIKNDRFKQYLETGKNKGWRLNALLRLNPVFPSALIGYFFGLTNIGMGAFAVSTFLFLIPASAAFISLGSAFTDIFAGNGGKSIIIKITLIVAWVAVWVVLRKLSTRLDAKKEIM
jgi:uncharacterized membrane protein YdjX (TVP38/TMEM64 family)